MEINEDGIEQFGIFTFEVPISNLSIKTPQRARQINLKYNQTGN
jgi:hypothetical protein